MNEKQDATAVADSHVEEERAELAGQLSDLSETAEEVHGLIDVLTSIDSVGSDDDEDLGEAFSDAEAALTALAREIDDRVLELRHQLTG